MKKIILLIITLVCLSLNSEEIVKTKDGKEIILYDDHTWIENKKVDNDYEKYLSQLRSGISASAQERVIACEMLSQGWKYTMPRPKSAQASWGNSDGRTTWWNGYWYNSQTDLYSNATPQKK